MSEQGGKESRSIWQRLGTERVILLAAAVFTIACLLYLRLHPASLGEFDLSRVPTEAPPVALFREQVLANPKTVLVEFGAEWCVPCKIAAPALETLRKEFPSQLDVVKIDIDREKQLAAYYAAEGIPLMLVFRDGKVRAGQRGISPPPHTLPELRALVSPHLGGKR